MQQTAAPSVILCKVAAQGRKGPRLRRLVLAAVAGLVLLLVSGCSHASIGQRSSSDSASNTAADEASVQGPPKPDLTYLDEGMLLPQSEFPGDGNARPFPLEAIRPGLRDQVPLWDQVPLGNCDLLGGADAAGQSVGLMVDTYEDSAKYTVGLFHTGHSTDVHEWASQCLPYSLRRGRTVSRVELPELPAGAVAAVVEVEYLDAPKRFSNYLLLGFVRGVLVKVSAGLSTELSELKPEDAASNGVALFKKQMALLESY